MSINYYYPDVPGLGNVAVSRHAQARATELNVSSEEFEKCLMEGEDSPDGMKITWREKNGLRLVILLDPTPNRGAKLVKTLYRVKAQADARGKQ